jgi:hypothetical protein
MKGLAAISVTSDAITPVVWNSLSFPTRTSKTAYMYKPNTVSDRTQYKWKPNDTW